MSNDEKVSLTISIHKEYRDRLRTMAAEQNLQDPDQLTSASTIARQIICDFVNRVGLGKEGAREDQIKQSDGTQAESSDAEKIEEARTRSCRTTIF